MAQALHATTERYQDRLHGVLSCYDRVVVTGTLPQACYAAGMTGLRGIRIFDYAHFAEPLRDAIRTQAQAQAQAQALAEAGIDIEHISKTTSARRTWSPR